MTGSNVYLGGFMGTGKTATGRELARLAGRPFLDLDELIERRLAMPIPRIFSERGEGYFRDAEARLVAEVAELKGLVVALGGGALLDEGSRSRLKATGCLVVLRAGPETIRERIGEGAGRPLLEKGDLEGILASRRRAYDDGDLAVDTEGLPPTAVAGRIMELLGLEGALRPGCPLPLEPGRSAFVGRGILKGWRELPGAPQARPFIVSDEITGPLYEERIGDRIGEFRLPRGEAAKRLDRIEALYRAFDGAGLDRSGVVLALGGGTVGDAAGFAAATWMRGIDVIQCPTTLLAQLDSSLGGKVGVNLDQGKNLVGAFHQPRLVVADVELLRSLSARDYRQGLAEAVKYGVGEEGELMGEIEESAEALVSRDGESLVRLVRRCGAIKLAVVDEDERERTGARARLNLGHTVGHALEAASAYQGWSHGDAVAAGMVVVAVLSRRLGLCDDAFVERLVRLLVRLGLPVRPDRPWSELLPHLRRDKKFEGGRPRLVLPRRGRPSAIEEIALSELEAAYEEVLSWNEREFFTSSTGRI